jgi:hypothetical protein
MDERQTIYPMPAARAAEMPAAFTQSGPVPL